MTTPLVSIGISIWNGEAFLAETLDSLLAQDYPNIEIVILDNLSIDKTALICDAYARKDGRVRYILDSEKRNVMDGQRQVFGYARGEYFMIACDDDVYAPSYVSTLMALMMADPSIGLAYSSYAHISPDGVRLPVRFERKYLLTRGNSRRRNVMHYMLHRNPIPIIFGLVRTRIHQDALPYYVRVDERRWDHDNLYLLRLLSLVKVDSTPEPLFFYRQRDRDKLYRDRGQLVPASSRLSDYAQDVLHQLRLTAAMSRVVRAAPFAYFDKVLVSAYAAFVLLVNLKRLTRRLIPISLSLRTLRRRIFG